ncbi:ABC transporter ATP-binding protein [Clostridium chromiireducens]|uniref:ABC transporter ATP-binding protein n=1 Tax=Clostridium chromiireducens TaxID=225345 RepID=A0A1V4IQS7_9CLOT|nr:ABC transporter ATP-binding protein [Clostridium chromiireducens]OPJ62170.1 macrolide export ATP-binding/permease protein MacB [Clostridium chromiireducens]RII35631.1 ABC transporter ATP-binding protein [Clostridium chromiireducens]
MGNNIIEMNNITKSFFVGKANQLDILRNINLIVKEGEFISIIGASGSGKSTLMNIIGVLDRQTSGKYNLDGLDISEVSDNNLAEIRNKKIGFVFQTSNLIARTNSLKNVELPMLYYGVERKTRINKAQELLDIVGMGDRLNHLPNELSGGQKQRVAIARALANDPSIILADEPTGALDSQTGRRIMDIFHKIHEEQGKTIILVTHNKELADETERIITIHDGRIIGEKIIIQEE